MSGFISRWVYREIIGGRVPDVAYRLAFDDIPPAPLEKWREDWSVSAHAAERWVERMGGTSDVWAARYLIEHRIEHALMVPNRHAAKMWLRHIREEMIVSQRKHGIRFHVYGHAVFIVAGSKVVTMFRASDEDVATLLTWLMLGQWCE